MEKGNVNQFFLRNSGKNPTWFSSDQFGTGIEKTHRASVSHTAACQLRAWLTRELSEDTAIVFVEDRGQAEGRKDAESLT